MSQPRALITGVCGQDGSYLAELLLEKGYTVYGGYRPTARGTIGKLPVEVTLNNNFVFLPMDLTDLASVEQAIEVAQPDEIYNLASLSFVGSSWENAHLVAEVNGLGALRVFETARKYVPKARIYQASTSEMFGNFDGIADEHTPFRPRSPYGVAKVFAHHAAVNYRESYNMHISCGIAFNHESPRRRPDFVTAKIITHAKNNQPVRLGNLGACRDWGYAKEYIEAIWLMLQQDNPDNYVIATGQTNSISDFIKEVKKYYDVNVFVDPQFIRPADIHTLSANPSKIKDNLGWEAKVKMPELVKIMCEEI